MEYFHSFSDLGTSNLKWTYLANKFWFNLFKYDSSKIWYICYKFERNLTRLKIYSFYGYTYYKKVNNNRNKLFKPSYVPQTVDIFIFKTNNSIIFILRLKAVHFYYFPWIFLAFWESELCYMHVCTYIGMYVHMCIHVCIHVCTHERICIYIHYVYTYAHTYIMYVCTYTWVLGMCTFRNKSIRYWYWYLGNGQIFQWYRYQYFEN